MELKDKKCSACSGQVEKLSEQQIEGLLQKIPEWELVEGKRIKREWRVKNFKGGMDFFNLVTEIAEEEKHHPDLHLVGYQFVTIEIWTHSIDGLSENDFILAAKIDSLPIQLSKFHKSKKEKEVELKQSSIA